jgi:hypothetical protein
LDEGSSRSDVDDVDLETLRDEFVDAFNARDLDTILDLVADDVEVPDLVDEGRDALRDELAVIWERFPGTTLTRAVVDGRPSAMAWGVDDEGCWFPWTLFTFDDSDGLLTLIEITDHPDELERAVAEDPEDEAPDEEVAWPEWDRAEDSRDVTYPLRIVEDSENDPAREAEEHPETASELTPSTSENT